MTGLVGRDPAADRAAEQIRVADYIEDLVTSELIGEAQLRVHDALWTDQDEITQPPALPEPRVLERADLINETERARRGDFLTKRLSSRHLELVDLLADR